VNATTRMPAPINALTVDVEDWYHDSELEAPATNRRVEANTDHVLELLAECGARATFFFLGEVAEQLPALARRVCEAGHEIGSHGYHHRRVGELTREEFRDDVRRSLQVIEDATGVRVRGYRAPYFSIKAGVRWPIEILTECGLSYDASILAYDRPPGLQLVCSRQPYRLEGGLWEIPVAVLQVGPFWHLPLASGGGLRCLDGYGRRGLWERAWQYRCGTRPGSKSSRLANVRPRLICAAGGLFCASRG